MTDNKPCDHSEQRTDITTTRNGIVTRHRYCMQCGKTLSKTVRVQ